MVRLRPNAGSIRIRSYGLELTLTITRNSLTQDLFVLTGVHPDAGALLQGPPLCRLRNVGCAADKDTTHGVRGLGPSTGYWRSPVNQRNLGFGQHRAGRHSGPCLMYFRLPEHAPEGDSGQ